MDHLAGHLVRRGVEAHARLQEGGEPGLDLPKIPAWGAMLLFATAVFFMGLLTMVSVPRGYPDITLTF